MQEIMEAESHCVMNDASGIARIINWLTIARRGPLRFPLLLRVWLTGTLAFAFGITGGFAWQLGSEPAGEMIRRVDGLEKTPAFQQESELVLACLQLKPGDVVADIGAGTGLFARPLARAVGPTGRVLAVDIDPELLRYIERRARDEKIPNIETILGEFDDPLLPGNRVDLAFIHDVLHHIERREAYLKTLSHLLKPRARIALIELNRDDPQNPHRNEPDLLVGKEQAVQWMTAAGFRPIAECNIYRFDEKWFLIFERK